MRCKFKDLFFNSSNALPIFPTNTHNFEKINLNITQIGEDTYLYYRECNKCYNKLKAHSKGCALADIGGCFKAINVMILNYQNNYQPLVKPLPHIGKAVTTHW